MDNFNNDTEQNILDAAIKVFTINGFYGTSLQMIADKSETNKALLHYYFRCKKQLFEKTFGIIITDFLKNISPVFENEEQLFDKIRHLIKTIILYGQSKRDYVNFLVTEMRREPGLITQFEKNSPVQFKKGILLFYRQVNEAIETRKIRQIQPQILLENIFSVSVSDIINEKFLEGLFGKNNKMSSVEEIIEFKTSSLLNGILYHFQI